MSARIEDLKSLIKQLSEKKYILSKIFDYVSDGILIIENDSNVILANSSFFKLLNIESKGNALTLDVIRNNSIMSKIIRETEKTDFIHYAREIECYEPEKRILAVKSLLLKEKELNVYRIFIVQDITANKILREEPFEKRYKKAMVYLAAGLAHEIGNPLNAMNIHIQLIKRMLNSKEFEEKQIQNIRYEVSILEDEIKRIDRIISQFIKAVRPDRLKFREIDIVSTIEKSIESFYLIAKQKKVNLKFHSDFERKFIFADEEKIIQAIRNIVKNAIEAVDIGGKVDVRCSESDGYINVAVMDNGPGIAEENISAIFNPFFTTKTNGLGLGLAIAYRAIKELEGDITVKSTPGKGSVFIIRIPLREYKLKSIESKLEDRK